MARNKISDLRDHLFETLEALKDDEKPMDISRAKAIADVARVLVDSAKVEVQFLQVTGTVKSTGFLPEDDGSPQTPPAAVGDSRRGATYGTSSLGEDLVAERKRLKLAGQ